MTAEPCDHLLGVGREDDYLLASLRESAKEAAYAGKQRWLAGGTGVPEAVARIAALDPEGALADEYDLFAYCPRCGQALP